MTFVRVQVLGLDSVITRFRNLEIKTRDLSRAWAKIGAKIQGDAVALAPVLTGQLVNSIRSSKAKTRTIVRAGNNRMEPYVPIQHYGGYNNIQAKPFLTTALSANEGYATREVSSEISRLVRSVGLD